MVRVILGLGTVGQGQIDGTSPNNVGPWCESESVASWHGGHGSNGHRPAAKHAHTKQARARARARASACAQTYHGCRRCVRATTRTTRTTRTARTTRTTHHTHHTLGASTTRPGQAHLIGCAQRVCTATDQGSPVAQWRPEPPVRQSQRPAPGVVEERDKGPPSWSPVVACSYSLSTCLCCCTSLAHVLMPMRLVLRAPSSSVGRHSRSICWRARAFVAAGPCPAHENAPLRCRDRRIRVGPNMRKAPRACMKGFKRRGAARVVSWSGVARVSCGEWERGGRGKRCAGRVTRRAARTGGGEGRGLRRPSKPPVDRHQHHPHDASTTTPSHATAGWSLADSATGSRTVRKRAAAVV